MSRHVENFSHVCKALKADLPQLYSISSSFTKFCQHFQPDLFFLLWAKKIIKTNSCIIVCVDYVVAAVNPARCVTDASVLLAWADDFAKHKLQGIVLQSSWRHPVLSPAVKYETNPILQGYGEGLVHDGGSHGGDGGHSHR